MKITRQAVSKKEKQLSGIVLSKAKEKKKKQLEVEYQTLISTIKGETGVYNAISKEVNEICKKKEDLTISIGILASEKGAYKKAIEMQKSKLKDKGIELRNMDKMLSGLDVEGHEMQKNLASLQKTSNEVSKYISNIDVIRKEKASLRQEIGRLKGTKSKIEDSIEDLEKDMIVAKKKQDKEIEKYVTATHKKADKATKASKDLILVETQLLESIDQLKAAEKDLLSKADDDVLVLKAEASNLEKEKGTIETDIFKARKELLDVQKQVSTQKDRLEKDLTSYENKKLDILDEVAQMKLKYKLDRIQKAGVSA